MTAGQCGADAGLQYAVARSDAVKCGVQTCPVQRVGNFADHLRNCPAQQPGIGVQRDDIPEVFRKRGADDGKTGITSTAQQPIKFSQLAAFAFPPHPDAFGRVPQAATMQKEKTVAVIRRIKRVQPSYGRSCRVNKDCVGCGYFGGAVY